MTTRAIVLSRTDNVGTLIDPGREGERCALQGEAEGEVRLLQDVPFGHKVCIRETAAGAEVLKYGQVIGRSSKPIKVGEHVHVHNVESARGRGDQAAR
jgi:altronate dehydratase small subunit